jgi:signal transduction histidine kinase
MTNYDKQNRQLAKLIKEKYEAVAAASKAESERARLYSILDGIMHETRRLNSEIASACDDISKSIAKSDFNQASLDADDAFYASGLISSRLTFADFEINPDSLTRQTKYSAGVYKKFDKARRILFRTAKRRAININIKGPSRNEIEVLPAFEMVPFVLVDNAVKYSPERQDVLIEVMDNPAPGCRVQVIVSSIGPIVSPDELPYLLLSGTRGTQATRSKIPGEGIGLYLADTLTRLANGRINVSSSPNSMYSIDGIAYSEFAVTLRFR